MKFLLGDWKAARIAWKTCLSCLGPHQTVNYRVWKIGGDGAETEKGKKEKEWVLEKVRVEWNLSFAVLKLQEEREPLQEKVWGFNGIPAGMVFGPSFSANGDNLHHAKGNNGLNAQIERVKANTRQEIPANILFANTRISSNATSTSTKPLPALPDHIPSTAIPLPPAQKGLSLSRFFTRPRTSSASKTRSHKPKRPDLPAPPFTCNDLLTRPVLYESDPCAPPATRTGAMLCSKFQQIDTFDNTVVTNPGSFQSVFNTDSESDPDAEAEADELNYYFHTQPEPEVDMRCAAASSVPVVSTSFPPLVSRFTFFRPGQTNYPFMEMRDEIRQEMWQREANSRVGGRKRDVVPTKVENDGKKAIVTVENKELKKIARTVETGDPNSVATKIKDKESKEGPTKVEDHKWNVPTSKAEEKKRDGFTRNLQLDHTESEAEEVETDRGEERGRSTRRDAETQTALKGHRAGKKMVLEAVPEISAGAESQETKENNQVRGKSEGRDVENQAVLGGRKEGKEKTLEASTLTKSHKVEEKNEVRGSSKRRDLKTQTTRKSHADPKEKNLERGTAASQRIESMATRKAEKAKPTKAEPTMQEPKLEYLQPVRFEGFNGEWREQDLIWEAEDRMKKEKLNGGK